MNMDFDHNCGPDCESCEKARAEMRGPWPLLLILAAIIGGVLWLI